MIKYKIENVDNELLFVFSPIIIGKDIEFKIQKPESKMKSWPVLFYTATTDMRDFIANITSINGHMCSVKGVYRGNMKDLKSVIVKEDKINKIGQRVMVTEHINVNGKLELLATTKRIINLTDSNLNFVNVGWSDELDCDFYRIDIYTGEFKVLKGDAVPIAKKG